MARIFICYRRDDSKHVAGRIYDRLVAEFGQEKVFKDVDSIRPGLDFRQELDSALAEVDVVLVLIGRRWLSMTDASGDRRLHAEEDRVRIEIQYGLEKKNTWVIPLLIDQTPMPKKRELPESISNLAFRHALEVRADPDFHGDVNKLIKAIPQDTGTARRPQPRAASRTKPRPTTRPEPRARRPAPRQIPPEVEFVKIGSGRFNMGSDLAAARERERPTHHVTLTKAFGLSVTPVTVSQFREFVKATDYPTAAESQPSGGSCHWRDPGFQQGPDHPVVCVSWVDAKAYCDWLSGQLGRKLRLPTEAEWEFACSAGNDARWNFGDAEGSLGRHAWFVKNSGNGTRSAGTRQPNRRGLYDMHGNVWEWCQDWYGPYSSAARSNPRGPKTGTYRVLRGGSWIDKAVNTRSAYRCRVKPEQSAFNFGFRVLEA